MRTWSVQDAKAKFSEMLETCLAEGPQQVTKRGEEAAVLVPIRQWRRMRDQAQPSLQALLLEPQTKSKLALPKRSQQRHRKAPSFS